MRRPDADASRAAARIAATSDRSITREGYAGSSHLASVPLILRAALAAALPLVLAASPSPAQVIEETQGRIDTLRLQARRDSCDATVFYALGIALFSRHRYDAADTAFAQAVAIDPRIAQGYLALGLVQDENRSYWNRLRREGQEAYDTERRRRIAFARKAFLLDPFVDIRLLIATPYIEAWPYLETQLKVTTIRFPLDSVAPGLLWVHALVAARTSRYREAIADAEALLRVSQAIESSDSIRAIPLRTNEFRYMLAALRQRSRDIREAVRLYQEVVANDLGNYMAHAQLARMLEADSNWTAALRERQAAVDANPDDHTLLVDLAITRSRAGDWPGAEEALLQARRMNLRDARVLYQLGITQQQLGKRDEARHSLETYLAIAPRGQVTAIEDARRRLGQLGG